MATIVHIDHLILHVSSHAESLRFYQQVLGFVHGGRVGPFEILRVNDGFTIDLSQHAPKEPVHLAFSMARADFDAVYRRLRGLGLPHGATPFDRNGGPPAQSVGARGMADAWYFDDPDGHNLEVRCY